MFVMNCNVILQISWKWKLKSNVNYSVSMLGRINGVDAQGTKGLLPMGFSEKPPCKRYVPRPLEDIFAGENKSFVRMNQELCVCLTISTQNTFWTPTLNTSFGKNKWRQNNYASGLKNRPMITLISIQKALLHRPTCIFRLLWGIPVEFCLWTLVFWYSPTIVFLLWPSLSKCITQNFLFI